MNEFEEKLENITEELNGKNVKIMFGNFINGEINFDNLNIEYDKDDGYLRLVSEENSLEFNTLDIASLNNDKSEIEINLDNTQNIRILKNRC